MKRILCVILAVQFLFGGIALHINADENPRVNIALNKPTTAESSYDGNTLPQRAVDGSTGNLWAWGFKNSPAWWQVDLEKECYVGVVEVVPRQDMDTPGTRQNYSVLGSNNELFTSYEVLGSVGVDSCEWHGVQVFVVDNDNKYRYVRIRKDNTGDLNFAEVRVFENLNKKTLKLPFVKPIDVDDSNVMYRLNLLHNFGILENGNALFGPDEGVTRALMAKTIIKILYESADTFSADGGFPDVPKDDEFINYISAAVSHGIMNPFEGNMFLPERYVTIDEAVKIIVSAAGYDEEAKAKGGYPSGYIMVAIENKILNGIKFSGTDEIDKKTLVNLIFNALNIKQNVIDGYGERVQKTRKGDGTLLNGLNIYRVKGTVTRNRLSSIDESRAERAGQVRIDDVSYNIGDFNFDGFLGYKVDCYARFSEDNDKGSIICFEKDKNTVEEILNHDDLLNTIGSGLLRDDIKAFVSGEARNYSVDNNADFIYNGIVKKDIKRSDLDIKNGNIKLIDNDGDGLYDVISINTFATIVMNRINAEEKLIVEKEEAQIIYLGKSENVIIEFYRSDGKMIKMQDVPQNISFCIYADKLITNDKGRILADFVNSKYIKFQIVDNIINGRISEILNLSKGNGNTFIINGNEYTESYDFALKEIDVPIDVDMVFMLDADGKIISATRKMYEMLQVGYLFAASEKNDIQSSGQFKILTTANEMKVYKSKSKIYHNNIKVTVAQALAEIDKFKPSRQMVVKYVINEDGFLTSINTPLRPDGEPFEGKPYGYLELSGSAQHRTCRRDGPIPMIIANTTVAATAWGNYAAITPTANVLWIPNVEASEELYQWKPSSSLQTSLEGTFEYYNSNDSYEAEIFVYFSHNNAHINNTTYYIARVVDAITEDGLKVKKAYAYQRAAGKEVGVMLRDNVIVSPGDAVQFGFDAAGFATKIAKRLDSKNIVATVPIEGNVYDDTTFIFGLVTDVKATVLQLLLSNGQLRPCMALERCNVLIWNRASGELMPSYYTSILTGDYIFVRTNYMTPKEILVIK